MHFVKRFSVCGTRLAHSCTHACVYVVVSVAVVLSACCPWRHVLQRCSSTHPFRFAVIGCASLVSSFKQQRRLDEAVDVALFHYLRGPDEHVPTNGQWTGA